MRSACRATAFRTGLAATLFVALWVTPARALDQGDTDCIPPGPECLQVAGGHWTFGSAEVPAIPQGFFHPGSEPFVGRIELFGGSGPLVLQRPVPICHAVGDPPATVPIELVQLSLQSVAPIVIPGAGLWNLEIHSATPNTPGTLTLDRSQLEGGVFELTLALQPRYVFQHLDPPFEVRVLDHPPVLLDLPVAAPWSVDDLGDPCGANGLRLLGLPGPNAPPCSATAVAQSVDGDSVELRLAGLDRPPCPPPPNDNCNAALLLAGDVDMPFDTRFATPDGPGTFMTGANVWFAYTADQTGVLTVRTCGSGFDTRLAVYAAPPCDGTVAPLATNDDHPHCGLGSLLYVNVAAGQMLLIEVGGMGLQAGQGRLHVSINDDPCYTDLRRETLPFDYDNDRDTDLVDLAALQVCASSDAPDANCVWAFGNAGGDNTTLSTAAILTAAGALQGPWEPQMSTEPLAPICPLPGALLSDPVPGFAWVPCPVPGALYRLHVYELPEGLTPADVIGFDPAALVVEELTQPWTPWPHTAAPLLPGRHYIWYVEAYDAFDPTIVYCGGAGGIVADVKTVAATSWEQLQELLKELEKIRKQLEEARKDFESNPLVEEVRLIQLVGDLLKNLNSLPQQVIDALEAFISCNDDALDGLTADQIKKSIELLKGILELYLKANDDLSAAKKQVIENIIEKIDDFLDGVGDLEDIKAVSSPDFNPWEYLKKGLVDKLEEAIKKAAEKALAKKLGEKAAGAIISILQDLYNFGDALFKLHTLEDLKRAWNLMMLKVIEKAGELPEFKIDPSWEWINRHVWINPCSEYVGAKFKVTPRQRCWQPDGSGTPGAGKWVDCKATFTHQGNTTYGADAEGKSSIEFNQSDMVTETVGKPPNQTTVCRYYVSIKLDPNCPGPCYVTLDVEVTKADGSKENLSFLAGVKQ